MIGTNKHHCYRRGLICWHARAPRTGGGRLMTEERDGLQSARRLSSLGKLSDKAAAYGKLYWKVQWCGFGLPPGIIHRRRTQQSGRLISVTVQSLFSQCPQHCNCIVGLIPPTKENKSPIQDCECRDSEGSYSCSPLGHPAVHTSWVQCPGVEVVEEALGVKTIITSKYKEQTIFRPIM